MKRRPCRVISGFVCFETFRMKHGSVSRFWILSFMPKPIHDIGTESQKNLCHFDLM